MNIRLKLRKQSPTRSCQATRSINSKRESGPLFTNASLGTFQSSELQNSRTRELQMWISADKSCLHFSNSQAFELNFGITPNHKGPCALPLLFTPFHFIATYFPLWSTKLLSATHICFEEYVFTLESQASLKSEHIISTTSTTISSAVHFNPVHQLLIFLLSHTMLHSYTTPWTLVRCLSSARQCNSSHCLQLRALILSRSSRRVFARFRNKCFNIPSNTTTCLLVKNSYMFRS